jgi:hypothetical protein
MTVDQALYMSVKRHVLDGTHNADGAADSSGTNEIACKLASGDGGDVRQLWIAEEASDDLRQALQPTQPAGDDRPHLLGPLGAAGATPSCLTFFHPDSSGLSCGG